MDRWSSCPGSVRLSVGIPNKTSAYAEEGTLAHEIAAGILTNQPPLSFTNTPEDMMPAVETYVDWVRGIQKAYPDSVTLIEQRLDLSHLYPGLFGTGDCLIYLPSTKHLIVADYKHGKGLPVEVVEDGKANVQLSYYALGALEATGYPVKTVELTVVQPRCSHPDGPIRSHTFAAIDILDFSADLIEYAKKTEDPEAPLSPGDHCRFCPAAQSCPALESKSRELARLEFKKELSYDPKKLSETLNFLPAVEAWIKNVREFAYAEAEQGNAIPGWKLVAKRATRKWKDEIAVRKFVATETNLDFGLLYNEPTLKSVAQIEKVVGKKAMGEFEPFIVSESTGSTLAPDSDKRAPAAVDPKTQFGVITD